MPRVLGINARNLLYIKPSLTKSTARILDNKLITKKVLSKKGIPVPATLGSISSPKELAEFDWSELASSFALKPNRGLGGEGIIVVFAKKKPGAPGPVNTGTPDPVSSRIARIFGKRTPEPAWIRADRSILGLSDIKNHILNIMDGTFSLGNLPDIAFFEERIKIFKLFKSYSFRGIPDIRIVVYNSIPVMAELRVPTRESEGKANLHLGAIGVGIDMGNGITTHAVRNDRAINYVPGSRLVLRGLKIPGWKEILELAIRAQRASGCQFIGADISIDRDRGPIILELNARPGLSIQIANMAPLRERLERVRGLSVETAKKGVKIAQDLFGGGLEEELEEISGRKIVGAREEIIIYGANKEKYATFAKIDTGAYRTSVAQSLADKLLLTNILKYKKVRGALGKQERPIIDLIFELDGEKVRTEAFIASREEMKHDVIIGRRDLKKFLIDPTKNLLLQK
ncbi:MAG: sugar-transfer associated ATP-grasp domain-containing protein [Candidatus Spechtbacterales bacterium]